MLQVALTVKDSATVVLAVTSIVKFGAATRAWIKKRISAEPGITVSIKTTRLEKKWRFPAGEVSDEALSEIEQSIL